MDLIMSYFQKLRMHGPRRMVNSTCSISFYETLLQAPNFNGHKWNICAGGISREAIQGFRKMLSICCFCLISGVCSFIKRIWRFFMREWLRWLPTLSSSLHFEYVILVNILAPR